MNPLGEQVLLVAKQYLGPAAQQFLSKELRALECTADTITPWHLPALSERARISALKIMDSGRASEFGVRVAKLGVPDAASGTAGGHLKDGASRLALDAAAKLYASGRLRQAEEAYRQLADKHGDADSFRGLAQTQVALEDIAAALLALRDGALSVGKRGDRTAAIGLLTDAVGIAPGDLAAHRRLAAAHANAGDAIAACAEYERYVDYALAEGDSRRAWLELTYARETLGDLPGLIRIVDRLMPGGAAATLTRADAPIARAVPPIARAVPPIARAVPLQAPAAVRPPSGPAARPVQQPAPLERAAAPQPAPSQRTVAQPAPAARSVAPQPAPAARTVAQPAPAARAVPQQVSPPPPPPSAVRRLVPAEPPAPQRIVIDDLPRTRPVGASSAIVMPGARTMTSADAFDEAPVDLAARIAPRTKEAQRKRSQAAWKARPAVDIETTLATLTPGTTPEQQAAVTAMRATILIGARDPRATETAIDAARRLLSLHKLQAASDLLLDYIGAGYTDREAQRLLIEVDCGLGRRDVARDKCRLLGEAYRLDGRIDTANDVERLGAII